MTVGYNSAGKPVVASSTSATAAPGTKSAAPKGPRLSLVGQSPAKSATGVRGGQSAAPLEGAYLAAKVFGNLPDEHRAFLMVRDAIVRACGVDPARSARETGVDLAFLNVIAPVLYRFALLEGGQTYFSMCVKSADADQALIARLLAERRAAFVSRMKAAKTVKRLRLAAQAVAVAQSQAFAFAATEGGEHV